MQVSMLARTSLAPARFRGVTPDERLDALKDWAVARLRDEIGRGKRGIQSELARKLETSTAHVANLNSGRSRPGEEILTKLASYWGTTYDQMMAEATGESLRAPTLVLVDERVPPAISRVAAARSYSADEVSVAAMMVRALKGTSDMTEEVAADLLTRARLSLRDGARAAAEQLGAAAANDSDDDIGGGLSSVPKFPNRKR